MGVMIDGRWTTDEEASKLRHENGRWIRPRSTIRHWVTPDGSAGPTGDAGFAAEPGRYHLFVSYGCPWAHRTLLFRVLKGLEDMISISVALPRRTEDGWVFAGEPGTHYDFCLGKHALWEVYAESHPNFTGRVTVPLLYDKKTGTAVNNESADIIRMLNSAFDAVGAKRVDFYPAGLREEIDALNARIYDKLNNGVYRAGFAETQEAYEEGFDDVFATLDFLDERLASLPLRRPPDRGGLAPVPDPRPLRRRLSLRLQVQPAKDQRLSESRPLHARPVPDTGHLGDRISRGLQNWIFLDQRAQEPAGHSAQGA